MISSARARWISRLIHASSLPLGGWSVMPMIGSSGCRRVSTPRRPERSATGAALAPVCQAPVQREPVPDTPSIRSQNNGVSGDASAVDVAVAFDDELPGGGVGVDEL